MPLACVVPTMVISSAFLLAGSTQGSAQTPPHGAESPQAVVAALERARTSGDDLGTFAVVSPRFRRELASELVTSVLMTLNLSNPDDWPVTLAPQELELRQRSYREALALVRQALEPHGLGDLIGKPPLSDDVAKALADRLDGTDTFSLLTTVFPLLDRVGRVLGIEEDGPPPMLDIGPVSDYLVKGDRATAKAASEMLEFERIDGRWYLAPPATGSPDRR